VIDYGYTILKEAQGLGYACKDAQHLRILILAHHSPEPAAAARNRERGRRLAQILSESGFEAESACIAELALAHAALDSFHPDLVFSAADHLADERGEPINVHGWLEDLGLPYVGSPPAVIDLALSKAALKSRWGAEGIVTPPWMEIDSSAWPLSGAAGWPALFPCIVKPEDGGNSRGIFRDSVVFDPGGLDAALSRLRGGEKPILVEHYLGLYPDFREITCAFLGNGEDRLIMPVELVFREKRALPVITTADKDGEAVEGRAIEDFGMREAAKAFAGRAFEAAGVRDYARCDLAFASGRFWAIEINGQPMVPDPWFEACARGAGLDERDYIAAIVGSALKRRRAPGGKEA